MLKRYFLKAAVSGDIEQRIKAAAAAELVTPSAWLRRVAIRALARQPSTPEQSAPDEHSGDLRDRPLCVRLSPDDALLLKARALARGMRPATYVSVLVRSHLRSLSPLPKDELLALRRTVAELGALTRDLHRIAHTLGRDGGAAAPEQLNLQAVGRLCQVVRSDTKALIRANVNSWELGRAVSAQQVRE